MTHRIPERSLPTSVSIYVPEHIGGCARLGEYVVQCTGAWLCETKWMALAESAGGYHDLYYGRDSDGLFVNIAQLPASPRELVEAMCEYLRRNGIPRPGFGGMRR